jgi:hypothetical protein
MLNHFFTLLLQLETARIQRYVSYPNFELATTSSQNLRRWL